MQELRKVDLYRYDESWERDAAMILENFFYITPRIPPIFMGETTLKPNRCVIDLRQAKDFDDWHLPGAVNIPLKTLDAQTPSPFKEPSMLESQWTELEGLFQQSGSMAAALTNTRVMVVCYSGDTSRVATSVLRAKGVEADNVRGGWKALINTGLVHRYYDDVMTAATGSISLQRPASVTIESN